MFDSIKSIVAIVILGAILTFSHGATAYVGYKAGSWYGYVKGVTHRILPWKREDGQRRRILPRPFNPGDAPSGSLPGSIAPTDDEYEVIEGVFNGYYDEDLNNEEN